MYKRIGNCDNCGAPFATRPGETLDCIHCGAALPSPLDDVGLGRASLHQLLGEAFSREDWPAVLDVIEHLLQAEAASPRIGRYLFFAGTIANSKLRDHAQALTYFDRAANADPTWITPLAARAEVLATQGRYREAEQDLRAAVLRAQVGRTAPMISRALWLALGNLLRDHLQDPGQGQACLDLANRCLNSDATPKT